MAEVATMGKVATPMRKRKHTANEWLKCARAAKAKVGADKATVGRVGTRQAPRQAHHQEHRERIPSMISSLRHTVVEPANVLRQDGMINIADVQL